MPSEGETIGQLYDRLNDRIAAYVAENHLEGEDPKRVAAVFLIAKIDEALAKEPGPCAEQFCGADGRGPCPSCGWDPFGYGYPDSGGDNDAR
jgi:hypothetical protein